MNAQSYKHTKLIDNIYIYISSLAVVDQWSPKWTKNKCRIYARTVMPQWYKKVSKWISRGSPGASMTNSWNMHAEKGSRNSMSRKSQNTHPCLTKGWCRGSGASQPVLDLVTFGWCPLVWHARHPGAADPKWSQDQPSGARGYDFPILFDFVRGLIFDVFWSATKTKTWATGIKRDQPGRG